MNDAYERFDEVYSISDLHLADGAAVDPTATALLADAIEGLATGGALKKALVVNGDSVDFLSVAPATYLDPYGAPAKLRRVFQANEAVWNALQAFAREGTVVFTLGNHDVELALPSCQALLRERLGGALILAFDGAGYRCRVGDATALFLHGNNQDGWNLVDFDRLGRIAARLNAGAVPEPWEPNDGTRLVIEVLNEQKITHPFIDYLKPESFWVLELIAKLGFSSLASQLAELGPRQFAARRHHAQHLDSPQAAYLSAAPDGPAARIVSLNGDELLRRADERYREGVRVLAGDVGDGSLGVADWFRKKPADDAEIRQHIRTSLGGDRTFDLNQSDMIYDELRGRLGSEVNWVVCGHTHLRRSYAERPDRAYFNSGTWMRLLDLQAATAASDDAFKQVLRGLRSTSTAELDAIRWLKGNEEVPLVLRQPTVVVLTAKDRSGWLSDVTDTGGLRQVATSMQRVTP